MERFDVSEGDRFPEMVSAAERGEVVEITREGTVVVTMAGASVPTSLPALGAFDSGDWSAVHRLTEPLRGVTGARLVRDLRDQDP